LPDEDLEREPGCACGLDDEERVSKVGRFVSHAMRRGEDGQRLHAKQNDGNQRHGDGDVKGILQHFDRWLLNK